MLPRYKLCLSKLDREVQVVDNVICILTSICECFYRAHRDGTHKDE
jgi:hypothetical protein